MEMYEKIREVRESIGMSRDDLANELGMSMKTITAVEVGNRTPQPTMLKELARQAKIGVGYFFDEQCNSLEEWEIKESSLLVNGEDIRPYIPAISNAINKNINPAALNDIVNYMYDIYTKIQDDVLNKIDLNIDDLLVDKNEFTNKEITDIYKRRKDK